MTIIPHVSLILIFAIISHHLLQLFIVRSSSLFLVYPNFRSSHNQPKPTAGGIVFVLLAVSSIALLSPFLHPSALLCVQLLAFPLSIVGLVDDCFGLSVYIRLIFQAITSFLFLLISPLASSLFSFDPFNMLCLFFLFFSIVAFINFVNFMDGMDGLLAGCISIALVFLYFSFLSPLPVFILIGSLLGFLSLNWSPSKVFMGDVGSTYLGAVFAGSVLQAQTWHLATDMLFLVTPLIADSSSTLFRRFIARQPLHSPHRQHLYQRLHQAGISHACVSSLYILSTAFIAFFLLVGGSSFALLASLCVIFLGLCLDLSIAVPFESN